VERIEPGLAHGPHARPCAFPPGPASSSGGGQFVGGEARKRRRSRGQAPITAHPPVQACSPRLHDSSGRCSLAWYNPTMDRHGHARPGVCQPSISRESVEGGPPEGVPLLRQATPPGRPPRLEACFPSNSSVGAGFDHAAPMSAARLSIDCIGSSFPAGSGPAGGPDRARPAPVAEKPCPPRRGWADGPLTHPGNRL